MIYDEDTGEIFEPKIRTPYNYDTDHVSKITGSANDEPSLTQQSFKDETDINQIVERFGVTGELPPQVQWPDQNEFIETFDFQSAQNIVVKAREAFMELPANVRAKFENNPQKFMDFFHDPHNQDAAIRMGIATDSRIKEIIEKKEDPPRGDPKE